MRLPGIVGGALGLLVSCAIWADSSTGSAAPGAVKPLASIRFQPDDDVKCLGAALETGDPAKGPSTYILKAPPGCLVRWHFHTAQEQVTVVRGDVLMEMIGHGPTHLGAGGFAVMESRMPHQFSCAGKNECLMVVAFDKAYDIFWGRG